MASANVIEHGNKLMEDFFIPSASPEEVAKEKAKARELRKKQWWKSLADRGICYYCGAKFPSSEITMDHLVPIIRGGKSTKGNIVPACKNCNNAKKHMLPLEWEDYMRKLSENSGKSGEKE